MFERFTDRARAVVHHALDEARTEGRRPVGTEHLLLGVLADSDSLAARLLAAGGEPARGLDRPVQRTAAEHQRTVTPQGAGQRKAGSRVNQG